MKHLIGTIISPSATFKEISQEKPWVTAILIIIFTTIITRLASIPSKTSLPAPLESPLIFTFATIPLFIALGLISWLIFSFLTYGVAKLFNGHGGLAETFMVISYSEIPFFFSILLIPISIIRLFSLPTELLMTSYWLSGLFQLALYIWSLVLVIIGLKEVHYFSYPRATGTACLPGCGCSILIFSFILVLAALGILSISTFLTP